MFNMAVCCCGRSDQSKEEPNYSAPSMQTYWVVVERSMQESLDGEITMLQKQLKKKQAMVNDPKVNTPYTIPDQDVERVEPEVERKLFFESVNKQLKPIIEALFKNYDITEAGELTRQQASDLFTNFMESQQQSFTAIVLHQKFQGEKLAALKADIEGKPLRKNSYTSNPKEAIAKAKADAEEKATSVITKYREEKADRDSEAFKLLDSRSEGKLTCEDLVAGFSIGTEKFTDFNHALGFRIDFIEVNQDSSCSLM